MTKQEKKQRNRRNDKAQRRITKQEEKHQNTKRNNKVIRGVTKQEERQNTGKSSVSGGGPHFVEE